MTPDNRVLHTPSIPPHRPCRQHPAAQVAATWRQRVPCRGVRVPSHTRRYPPTPRLRRILALGAARGDLDAQQG